MLKDFPLLCSGELIPLIIKIKSYRNRLHQPQSQEKQPSKTKSWMSALLTGNRVMPGNDLFFE